MFIIYIFLFGDNIAILFLNIYMLIVRTKRMYLIPLISLQRVIPSNHFEEALLSDSQYG